VSKRSGFYPCPAVDGAGTQVVSQAGAVLLTDTLATVGLDRVLSTALGPWRPRWAVHDPAKVLLDLALGLAIGGDCMARGHRSHADLRRATPAPSACRVRRPLQQRGRIGRCGCGRHHRFPSRSMAGSAVDQSWAGSSTSTRQRLETAGQAPSASSGTRQGTLLNILLTRGSDDAPRAPRGDLRELEIG